IGFRPILVTCLKLYCKTTLKADKLDLVKQATSEKHKKKTVAQSINGISVQHPTLVIFSFENSKIVEFKIAVFIAEHCSINIVNHLSELLLKLDPQASV
ncbi:hypothetical protein ABEB36_006436, partial [Hypothenemus hampei]